MKTIKIKGVEVEIRGHGFWYDHQIIFYSDPGESKYDIIQWLYDEGFIQDRRTPTKILELS